MAASSRDDSLGGLECPVCRDRYLEPRVLPCGHTFCLECLRQVAGIVPSLRCPECRAEYRVPLGGVQNFSKNVAVLRQLEARCTVEKYAPLEFSLCPGCQEEDELKICGHCEKSICFSCQNEHLPEFKEQVQNLAQETQRGFISALDRDDNLVNKPDFVSGKTQCTKFLEQLVKRGKFSPAKLSKVREELEQIRQRMCEITGRRIEEYRPDPSTQPIESVTPTSTHTETPVPQSPSVPVSTQPDSTPPTTAVPRTTTQTSYPNAWREPFHSSVLDKDVSRIKLRFGTCGSFPGQFSNPQALAIDKYNGDIIVVDEDNHRIQIFQASGKLRLCFGSRASGAYEFSHPKGIAVNDNGQIIISDQYNHRLKIHNRDGTLDRVIGGRGFTGGLFNYPAGLAIDRSQNIHVCDQLNRRIQILDQQGHYLWQYEPRPSWHARHISISTSGLICVSDDATCVVLGDQYQAIDSWTVPGTISGLCLYKETFVLVSDYSHHKILLYSLKGDLLKAFDLGAGGQYREPRGLAVDRHGNINVACSAMILKF